MAKNCRFMNIFSMISIALKHGYACLLGTLDQSRGENLQIKEGEKTNLQMLIEYTCLFGF